MNKYETPEFTRQQQEPKHSKEWGGYIDQALKDYYDIRCLAHTPGKHAKPFAKHHPATPAIYNQAGNVVPLFPTANVLDVAA